MKYAVSTKVDNDVTRRDVGILPNTLQVSDQNIDLRPQQQLDQQRKIQVENPHRKTIPKMSKSL